MERGFCYYCSRKKKQDPISLFLAEKNDREEAGSANTVFICLSGNAKICLNCFACYTGNLKAGAKAAINSAAV
jgi:hypothetical protein